MEQTPGLEMNDYEKATQYLYELTINLLELQGSDIFITAGSPPALKVNQAIHRVGDRKLTPQQTALLARSIMHDRQAREFDQHHEVNFSLNFPNIARFRVSAFTQRGSAGMVLRLIQQQIPKIDELNLPSILKDIAITPRGLVIFLGGTGCGKTTSLAAMLDYRNEQCQEHIVTVEDPIEFFHRHKQCLVDQREVGTDTDSYETALRNTLRQAPNVIMIGEVRDRETMQHAINFAETGHLCLTTLHANNTDQAFDRIVNFFPEEKRTQILMDLSFNMKAFISQRLLPREDQAGPDSGSRSVAQHAVDGGVDFSGTGQGTQAGDVPLQRTGDRDLRSGAVRSLRGETDQLRNRHPPRRFRQQPAAADQTGKPAPATQDRQRGTAPN